jgi:hypothetical protein
MFLQAVTAGSNKGRVVLVGGIAKGSIGISEPAAAEIRLSRAAGEGTSHNSRSLVAVSATSLLPRPQGSTCSLPADTVLPQLMLLSTPQTDR